MTDFKVGDKVRVIRSPDELVADSWIRVDSESGVRPGDIGEISSMDGICACVDFDGQENFYMNCEQLELVTEPAGFKVGDRVVHKVYGGGIVSAVDVVETTLPYRVDFSDTFYQWVFASELTPENTTKTTETPKAETERKFKVGDRVESRLVSNAGIGTILKDNENGTYQVKWNSWYAECCDPEASLRLATPKHRAATSTPKLPAIVALIEHGQPKPSSRPFVHDTTAAATKEAERLAGKHPGQKFGVYQLVTARIGTVSVAEA